MPQLNPQIQQSVLATMSLAEVLEDIVTQVQIQPNLTLSHPCWDALELRSEVQASLEILPIALQDQYLRLRIGRYLYSIYDSEGDLRHLDPNRNPESLQRSPAFNMAQGLKSTFYTALHNHNTGAGYFDPGWLVLNETSDGLLATQKDELTIHVSRDRHLSSVDQSAAIGDWVAIHLPRNLLEDECYVALSNVGPPHPANPPQAVPLVNVYFNLSPVGVLTLMESLTTALNPLNLPFKLRVPLEETDCDRPDAICLTFRKVDYDKVQPVLSGSYQNQQTQFRPKTPLFTKFLAPGLALAEQPYQPFTAQESFSLNRYQIVAEGLLTAWRQQMNDKAECMSLIRQRFLNYQLSLDFPYLNPGSEDLDSTILVTE